MCDPVSAIAIVGTGAAIYQGYQQQEAQNKASEYNAKIAEHNAAIAGQQAEQAGIAGEELQKDLRTRGRTTAGAQRSIFAASGVDLGSGSVQEVLKDTAKTTAMDAMTARYNTQVEVWAAKNQQWDLASQARLSRMQMQDSSRSALLTGVTTGSSLGLSAYASRPRG